MRENDLHNYEIERKENLVKLKELKESIKLLFIKPKKVGRKKNKQEFKLKPKKKRNELIQYYRRKQKALALGYLNNNQKFINKWGII